MSIYFKGNENNIISSNSKNTIEVIDEINSSDKQRALSVNQGKFLGNSFDELEETTTAHIDENHCSTLEREYWNNKQESITFDTEATKDSDNLVSSGFVYNQLQNSCPKDEITTTLDVIDNKQTEINNVAAQYNRINPNLIINSSFESGRLVYQRQEMAASEYWGVNDTSSYGFDTWRLFWGHIGYNSGTGRTFYRNSNSGHNVFALEHVLPEDDYNINPYLNYTVQFWYDETKYLVGTFKPIDCKDALADIVTSEDGLVSLKAEYFGVKSKQLVICIYVNKSSFNFIKIKLELGDTPTPYIYMPYDEKLMKCRRYLKIIGCDCMGIKNIDGNFYLHTDQAIGMFGNVGAIVHRDIYAWTNNCRNGRKICDAKTKLKIDQNDPNCSTIVLPATGLEIGKIYSLTSTFRENYVSFDNSPVCFELTSEYNATM